MPSLIRKRATRLRKAGAQGEERLTRKRLPTNVAARLRPRRCDCQCSMNQTPAAGAFPKLALKSDSWRNIPISLKAPQWSEIACFPQLGGLGALTITCSITGSGRMWNRLTAFLLLSGLTFLVAQDKPIRQDGASLVRMDETELTLNPTAGPNNVGNCLVVLQ